MPQLTVIVCTHNRTAFLEKCLASLANQTCGSDLFEVLVVDNASTDNTAEISSYFVKTYANFRYHLETKLGLARARNAGLDNTETHLAAFTDDDAIPDTHWVELMLKRFSSLSDDVAVLGGEIKPVWESVRPAWLTDNLLRPLSAHLGWDVVARRMKSNEWVCEVNCCYRTEIIKRYGGFPESLGRKGDLLLSGENYINERILADGYCAFFDPDIFVNHFIPAERMTKTWFMRRFFWQGVTGSVCAEYDRKEGRKPEYLQSIRLPSNADEWWAVLDNEHSSLSIEDSCALAANLGYVLGIRNMVIGR